MRSMSDLLNPSIERLEAHPVPEWVERVCADFGVTESGLPRYRVIWNPDREFQVVPELIHHRHKLTPYAGEVLRGVVEKTFLRGQIVYDGGEFPFNPRGQIVLREKN